jgi:hypothetical protein
VNQHAAGEHGGGVLALSQILKHQAIDVCVLQGVGRAHFARLLRSRGAGSLKAGRMGALRPYSSELKLLSCDQAYW